MKWPPVKWKYCWSHWESTLHSATLLRFKLLSAHCFGLLVSMIKSQRLSLTPSTHSPTPLKLWTAAYKFTSSNCILLQYEIAESQSKQVMKSQNCSKSKTVFALVDQPGLKHQWMLDLTGSEKEDSRRLPKSSVSARYVSTGKCLLTWILLQLDKSTQYS